jgi:hypothetical protein
MRREVQYIEFLTYFSGLYEVRKNAELSQLYNIFRWVNIHWLEDDRYPLLCKSMQLTFYATAESRAWQPLEFTPSALRRGAHGRVSTGLSHLDFYIARPTNAERLKGLTD